MSEVIANTREVLRDASEEIRTKQEKLDQLQADIDSGKFDRNYINFTMLPEVRLLRAEIEDIKAAVTKKAGEILDAYEDELDKRDILVPGEITEDAALFNLGVTLTEKDLTAILERNSNNHTMTLLTLRYAKEKGIDLGRIYIGGAGERNVLFWLRDIVGRYTNHWITSKRADEMLDSFFDVNAE